jgi:hypothetical protein
MIACLFPGAQQIIGGANVLLYLARIIRDCSILIFNQLKITYYQYKTDNHNFNTQIEQAKTTIQRTKWNLIDNALFGLCTSCMLATPILGTICSTVVLINPYIPYPRT